MQIEAYTAVLDKKQRHWGIVTNSGDRDFVAFCRLLAKLNAKHRSDLRLLDAKLADFLVVWSDAWQIFAMWNTPFCIDQLVAYEAPGKKLGKTIRFKARDDEPEVTLETGKHAGLVDVCLVATGIRASDFKSRSKRAITVAIPDDRWRVVPKFPAAAKKWYRFEPETLVPSGRPWKDKTLQFRSRFLFRGDGPYVGPVMRMAFSETTGREIVGAYAFWADVSKCYVVQGSEAGLAMLAEQK